MIQYKSSSLIDKDIVIRQGTVADYEQILELMKAFAVFQKTPEKLTVTLEQMVEDKDVFRCFVAVDRSSIIAFASFFFGYYSWSGKGLYLDDLYVKDEYRKSGIGTKILNAVIQYAKEHQCKSVRWLVSRWNENAISFYKKIGAIVDDTDMPCVYQLK